MTTMSEEIGDYCIARGANALSLVASVKDLIGKGWHVLGSPYFVPDAGRDGFQQAMVKPVEKPSPKAIRRPGSRVVG